MAERVFTTSRRRFLGHAAGAAFAVGMACPAIAELDAELAVLREATVRLNAQPASDEDHDALSERERAVLARIEALPATRENAGLKARAIEFLHEGDLARMAGDGTRDQRLAAQIVTALVAA